MAMDRAEQDALSALMDEYRETWIIDWHPAVTAARAEDSRPSGFSATPRFPELRAETVAELRAKLDAERERRTRDL